jgi:hypothetical protein
MRRNAEGHTRVLVVLSFPTHGTGSTLVYTGHDYAEAVRIVKAAGWAEVRVLYARWIDVFKGNRTQVCGNATALARVERART